MAGRQIAANHKPHSVAIVLFMGSFLCFCLRTGVSTAHIIPSYLPENTPEATHGGARRPADPPPPKKNMVGRARRARRYGNKTSTGSNTISTKSSLPSGFIATNPHAHPACWGTAQCGISPAVDLSTTGNYYCWTKVGRDRFGCTILSFPNQTVAYLQ